MSFACLIALDSEARESCAERERLLGKVLRHAKTADLMTELYCELLPPFARACLPSNHWLSLSGKA